MKKAVALTAMVLTLTLGVNAQTVDVNGAAIQNVGTPTSATDAAVNGDVLNNATNISNNATAIATINDSLGSVNDSINIIKTAVAALPTNGQWIDITGNGSATTGDGVFYNGWQPRFSSQVVSYMKDANGFVHLRGNMDGGSAANSVMFVLPAGYRPAQSCLYSVPTGAGTGKLSVGANGEVKVPSGGSTIYNYVDGVSFLAEN